jgi:hypothetical protein
MSYLTMAASGIGLILKTDAVNLLNPLSVAVRSQFSDWAEFAQFHEAGEILDGTNNAIGRKLLKNACGRLLTEPASPWVMFPMLG